MNRLVFALAMSLFAIDARSATLGMSVTAPNQYDRDTTCTAPDTIAMTLPNSNLRIHFVWTGPSSGEDSLYAPPGFPVTMFRVVPPGTYKIVAWASEIGRRLGCRDSIYATLAGPPAPARVKFKPR